MPASVLDSPVYRQPGFVPFLISRLCAVFAMQIQAIVVAWQVYDITCDPLTLGYVGLTQFLSMVVLLLPAGDVVDRFDRKRYPLLRGAGAFWRRARLYRPDASEPAAADRAS